LFISLLLLRRINIIVTYRHENLNPSFRVFEFDSNSKLPKDYIQYRFNVTQANLNPDVTPEWDISYRATEFFQVNDLSEVEKISAFVDKITTDEDIYKKTCKSFFADGVQYDWYVNDQSKL
jgi:hypothetical protein